MSDARRSAEGVHDPDRGLGHEVRLEVAPQEDGAATPPGAALHQVAGDVPGADQVERLFQVVDADPAHGRPREVGHELVGLVAQATGVAQGGEDLGVAAQQPERIGDLDGRRARPLLEVADQLLDAQLVLDVVLVEQRALEQVQVAVGAGVDLAFAHGEHALLEDGGPQADVLGQLEQLAAAGRALEVVQDARPAGAGGRVAPPRPRWPARSRWAAPPGAGACRTRPSSPRDRS